MTKIQWTDKVWNPVTGCTKVSAGCKNCYAERIAGRRLPAGGFVDRAFTDVRCHPERLDAPLRWRKPRRVFVNSMSDLFHEDVPAQFIGNVFNVCSRCPQHTFQVLTKRPERMRRIIGAVPPPPNVWLGVSVEDQATADERIPLLLQTPAAVRFVSYEPALGPVRLTSITDGTFGRDALRVDDNSLGWPEKHIDWVIVGGESGPGARPCDVAWVRSVVEQCRAAGVPCFVKQLGARPVGLREECDRCNWQLRTGRHGLDCPGIPVLRGRKGGDPAEWPEDLRVREFPGGAR